MTTPTGAGLPVIAQARRLHPSPVLAVRLVRQQRVSSFPFTGIFHGRPTPVAAAAAYARIAALRRRRGAPNPRRPPLAHIDVYA